MNRLFPLIQEYTTNCPILGIHSTHKILVNNPKRSKEFPQ